MTKKKKVPKPKSKVDEKERIDHDQIFKKLIREFFKEFIELFLPSEAKLINFKKVEFLDKENFTDVPRGKHKILDLVVKVGLKGGGEEFILIHTEFESQKPRDLAAFAERMFMYCSQLYLRYKKPVIPIAVFSDDSKWQTPVPSEFKMGFADETYVSYKYRQIKLKNYNWKDFIKNSNPLTYALMAKMDFDKKQRAQCKADFLRMITGKRINLARKSILVDFIENYIILNNKEQNEFDSIVKQDKEFKEVIKMITVYEKRGIEKGEVKKAQEAVIDVLKARNITIPKPVKDKVTYCDDLKKLKNALILAATIKSLDDFTI